LRTPLKLRRLTRLMENPKGFSSIVGAIFMVLIVIFLATSVFLYSLNQNTLYNGSVRERNQNEADRRNENVVASTFWNFSVSSNIVSVQAQMTNLGSVAVQIVNVWVFDASKQTYGFNNSLATMSAAALNPGEMLDLTGAKAMNVSVPGASSADDFNVWFVTERGNSVALTRPQEIVQSDVATGIGKIGMDFDAFVCYRVNSSYALTEWATGGLSGFYPPNVEIAFRLTLTNFDPDRRPINLTSHSALWAIFKTGNPNQPRSQWWHICNVNSTGWITSKAQGSFVNVTLLYNTPVTVYFGTKVDLALGTFARTSPDESGCGAVNLMLLGSAGTSNFGQNIPFVSIYVT